MKEFYQQLRKAMNIRNVTQTELCVRTGIPKSAMSQYISGAFKPKQKRTYLLSKALNVNEAWLMGCDDVPMEIVKPQSEKPIESNIGEVCDNKKIKLIPVFESVSAGFGSYADEHVIDYMPLYIESDYDAENMLAIKVKGDSMYPKIENGDIVAVRKQSDFENGNIVVILVDGDEGLVKKIYQDNEKVKLVSINPEYPDKLFYGEEADRLKIVGVVKQIIKNL